MNYNVTFLKCSNVSGLFWHISVIRVTPVISTPTKWKFIFYFFFPNRFWCLPWFFSDNKLLVAGKNISNSSGTRLIILYAHSAAFFLIYALGDFISRSTSEAKSLAISGEAMAPKVQSASPTANCVVEFKSLKNLKPLQIGRLDFFLTTFKLTSSNSLLLEGEHLDVHLITA